MGKAATASGSFGVVLAALLTISGASAQGPATTPDWRHVGNSLIDLSLAGLATGPMARVWYSGDGATLYAATASGRVFETGDFETWQGSAAAAPADSSAAAARLPENGARVRGTGAQSAPIYAVGRFAYRSEDGGANWENLTGFRSQSILGPGLQDLAISPRNADEITVAGAAGVFRSLDGGKSWSGLNQGLPNLPAARLRALPSGDRGVELELPGAGVVEWQPGEKQAWRPADASAAMTEMTWRRALDLTAIQIVGDTVYQGTGDGRITVSSGDSSQTFAVSDGGPVQRFWVDPQDPRVALAVLGSRPHDAAVRAAHVLRTENGGGFWDDLTANLPDVGVRGVTASRPSGAVYVATDRGVFFTRADLNGLGGATPWQALAGLPQAAVTDVLLDASDIQLWAAVDGYGVYATLAPHRLGDPKVVSAADMVARAAAPGSLMSVVGARVASVRAGDVPAPVLAATDTESQIQIPFEARGDTVSLSLDPGGPALAPLRLESASPAIFVDRDGSPLLLDANTGTMLDAMNPARSRARIQILATGLGRVKPDWPSGMQAPLDNPPSVAGQVQAWLDRSPVNVTRAVLAPGYVGFYLVEIEVPKIVNYGPAELYLEVDGHASNRVRVYIEP